MTPEQLSALRIAAEARWRLNGIRDLLDAVDEIERLQSELATATRTAEEQTLTILELEKELARLKTPPRCPKR